MEAYKAKFDTTQKKRKANKEYLVAQSRCQRRKAKLSSSENHKKAVKDFKRAQKAMIEIPYFPAIDPRYKRIQYNRYTDDFVVGVIGSKADTEMNYLLTMVSMRLCQFVFKWIDYSIITALYSITPSFISYVLKYYCSF